MNTLDVIIYTAMAVLAATFVYIIWSYAKGLKNSPREIWLLFLTKITEYGAYGSMNVAFSLFLTADAGLGDIAAGTYIGIWSIILTVVTMLIGAVVDAIGVKKTLLTGTVILLFARMFLPFFSNIYLVTLFGFIPLAFGMAMMGPVLSVGIKKFTTKETAALGFGLFYTLLNVGWAFGAWIFDTIRGGIYSVHHQEHVLIADPIFGIEFSTYQIIFAAGFLLTIPNLIMILFMRDRVELTENEGIVVPPPTEKQTGNPVQALYKTAVIAGKDTVKIFKEVIKEKTFWYFIFMLGILVFVRLVFYHFHYTFPKYGVRVLGEGLPIGSIYGLLNPVMIIFLTPLIAALTRKISSYKLLVVGTFISSFSVFIASFPAHIFEPLMNTWFGEIILVRWLEVPVEQHQPLFLALVIFIMVFTIGESIWSPRLMQFTAEIAPPGKEGSYIALSYIPYFAAKLFVGPLSGWLVAEYTPEGLDSYPNHYMVWIWIGVMAALSPLGLVVFRKLFLQAERKHLEDNKPA